MSKNPKWTGAMCKTELSFDELAKLSLFDVPCKLFCNHPGMSAWLLCSKVHSWRYGPAAIPLPGIAALWYNGSVQVAYFIQLIPVDGLLTQGISPTDLAVFLNSPSGTEYFNSKANIVRIDPGQAAFSPAGMLAVPIAVSLDILDKSLVASGRKVGDSELPDKKLPSVEHGFILHMPLLERSMCDHVPAASLSAITNMNIKHLEKNATSRLWAPRLEAMKDFIAGRPAQS